MQRQRVFQINSDAKRGRLTKVVSALRLRHRDLRGAFSPRRNIALAVYLSDGVVVTAISQLATLPTVTAACRNTRLVTHF